ncbi:hypothetical protein PpBr36_04894 [Pyricularia pennisetigena]|uniref:hypothetical protein n=1 Tax=Pyricularia pennisetigena TaxID=1578925 RepID=UPI00115351C7|nr:hypothetical protein PpBr36_04894 [Pyricularia pennisetigena]TLS26270.1 hypothetical protein PpBr36_04894 [Pyricularia pennisetigena]
MPLGAGEDEDGDDRHCHEPVCADGVWSLSALRATLDPKTPHAPTMANVARNRTPKASRSQGPADHVRHVGDAVAPGLAVAGVALDYGAVRVEELPAEHVDGLPRDGPEHVHGRWDGDTPVAKMTFRKITEARTQPTVRKPVRPSPRLKTSFWSLRLPVLTPSMLELLRLLFRDPAGVMGSPASFFVAGCHMVEIRLVKERRQPTETPKRRLNAVTKKWDGQW